MPTGGLVAEEAVFSDKWPGLIRSLRQRPKAVAVTC